MTVPEAARTHQEERARLATLAARSATTTWDRIDPDLIAQSWGTLVPAAVAATSAAQRAAAQTADTYLDAVAPGLPAAGRVASSAYAGVASDGRPLETLLLTPVSPVLSAIATGNPVPLALATGRLMLELLVRTMVADAGRAADTTAMAARRDVTGYVRVVEVGACARCIVLAGREYEFDAGFLRHPRCQCSQAPLFHSNRLTRAITPSEPQEIFESLSPAEQDRVFGQAGAEAIRSGADIDQVVNARRGMSTATVHGRSARVTTESTTARGVAARRMGAPGQTRLMPEQILADADDREHAIRLLRLNGYLAGEDAGRPADDAPVELTVPESEPEEAELEPVPDIEPAQEPEAPEAEPEPALDDDDDDFEITPEEQAEIDRILAGEAAEVGPNPQGPGSGPTTTTRDTPLRGEDAYRHAPFSRGEPFTPRESKRLFDYTGTSGMAMNYRRRHGEWFPGTTDEQAAELTEQMEIMRGAFAKSPPTTEWLEVIRGFGRSHEELFGEPGSMVGGVFRDKAFISTAAKPLPGFQTGRVRILLPPGSRPIAMGEAEWELLLPDDARFRVVRDELDANGERDILLEYIPGDADDAATTDADEPADAEAAVAGSRSSRESPLAGRDAYEQAVFRIDERFDKEELQALGSYVGFDSGELNFWRRHGRFDDVVTEQEMERISKLRDAILRAFDKSEPLAEWVEVWRGVSMPLEEWIGPVGSRLGGVVRDKAFVSTSTVQMEMWDAGRVKILLPPGTPAIAMGEDEMELLIREDAHFRVLVDELDQSGKRNVVLEYLP